VANLLSRLESLLFGAAIGRASSEAVTPVLEPVRQRSWLRNRVRVLDPGSAARLAAQGLVQESEAEAEAARNGYDLNRLGAMIRLAQTTPGVSEAFALRRRGEISEAQLHHVYRKAQIEPQYYGPLDALLGTLLDPAQVAAAIHRGLLEDPGLLKGEAVLEQSRQIPTARDFFENALRGYHGFDWALDQAKRHGMSEADATVIYQNQGRPMNIHAIQQALARGAKFNPEPGEITDPFDAAIVEGNLKPGYYEMAKSLRFTLPSVFTMRALAESGVWSEAKTAERLKWAGWLPADADEAAKAWSSAGGTTKKGLTVTDLTAEYEARLTSRAEYVANLREAGLSADAADRKADLSDTKARRALQRQLVSRIRIRYTGYAIDRPAAEAALRSAGVPAEQIAATLEFWDVERDINVHTLTEAQIVKAFARGIMNRDTATMRLEELGLAAGDIDARLDE
jgi:hypothetical protein